MSRSNWGKSNAKEIWNSLRQDKIILKNNHLIQCCRSLTAFSALPNPLFAERVLAKAISLLLPGCFGEQGPWSPSLECPKFPWKFGVCKKWRICGFFFVFLRHKQKKKNMADWVRRRESIQMPCCMNRLSPHTFGKDQLLAKGGGGKAQDLSQESGSVFQ